MKRLLLLLLLLVIYGCTGTETVIEPEATREKVDFSTLLEPPKEWHQLDEQRTQFRGVSSRLSYETFLKGKKPQREVIVAVIDGGVDINHEDLKEVLWTNRDEIPGNEMDDDGNGYVDDVHGWNFIGGPEGNNVHHDTFELTRIYRRLNRQFADTDSTGLQGERLDKFSRYRQIRSEYEEKVRELYSQYNNVQSLERSMQQAEEILTQYYDSVGYSYQDLQELEPENQQLQFARSVMLYVMENDIDSTVIADQKKHLYEFAKYGYNPDFSPRHIVGDDYDDQTERYYGNSDVAGPDPSHGTHVAGIVAAARNNGTGIDGIAANTRIMVIRAVPNGDERDKDVANAILYAVENGADVINMSFGKSYSPHKEVVDKAIRYADENGVLMIHGAGNDAQNLDNNPGYPSPYYGSRRSGASASLWLTVGASSWKPGEEFVASFSNYGSKTVDLFAPGVDIYSTMPGNSYEFEDGTSMASPVVAGIAALVMAHYPNLSPRQVRDLIFDNTIKYDEQRVILPNEQGASEPLVRFDTLSTSGGLVNVYRVLQAAETMRN